MTWEWRLHARAASLKSSRLHSACARFEYRWIRPSATSPTSCIPRRRTVSSPSPGCSSLRVHPLTPPQTETLRTRCCIAGGGPAGVMLGFLLARAGVDVIVLEKHADFLRDFRGDTIHPSTLEL